MQIVSPDF